MCESDMPSHLPGIPLTVQSGRPSSRSSIRSSGGSIGSYGNRRSSTGGVGGNNSATAGSKGILVSTSRTGAARSAAILLISCHLTTLSKQSAASRVSSRQTSGAGCSANSRDNLDENGSDPGSQSCDSTLSMARHLQKQLNHQRHLLSFELSPAKTKNHDRVRALLGLNGIDNYRSDDDALNSLDNGLLQIGALPTPASETPRFAVNISKKINTIIKPNQQKPKPNTNNPIKPKTNQSISQTNYFIVQSKRKIIKISKNKLFKTIFPFLKFLYIFQNSLNT